MSRCLEQRNEPRHSVTQMSTHQRLRSQDKRDVPELYARKMYSIVEDIHDCTKE